MLKINDNEIYTALVMLKNKKNSNYGKTLDEQLKIAKEIANLFNVAPLQVLPKDFGECVNMTITSVIGNSEANAKRLAETEFFLMGEEEPRPSKKGRAQKRSATVSTKNVSTKLSSSNTVPIPETIIISRKKSDKPAKRSKVSQESVSSNSEKKDVEKFKQALHEQNQQKTTKRIELYQSKPGVPPLKESLSNKLSLEKPAPKPSKIATTAPEEFKSVSENAVDIQKEAEPLEQKQAQQYSNTGSTAQKKQPFAKGGSPNFAYNYSNNEESESSTTTQQPIFIPETDSGRQALDEYSMNDLQSRIEVKSYNLNYRAANNQSIVHQLARIGDLDSLKKLYRTKPLEFMKAAKTKDISGGWTPPFIAAKTQKIEVYRWFLEIGFSKSDKDNYGRTLSMVYKYYNPHHDE